MIYKIYVSGKITGLNPELAEKIFSIYAKAALNTAEVMDNPNRVVRNPLTIKPLFGIRRWFFFMWNDIRILRKCTHIAMIPNWTDSKGACIEHFIGKFIFKLKVIELPEIKWRNEI